MELIKEVVVVNPGWYDFLIDFFVPLLIGIVPVTIALITLKKNQEFQAKEREVSTTIEER
ncbi:hypothetical protein MGH68_13930 [Erysipelothrix sp. D19-032]